MPDPNPTTYTTLGQRIDALLGPLETEAQQVREAIALGRQQVSAMEARITQAEQALVEIESQMTQVLDTMAHDEPLLARAMGRTAATDSAVVPKVTVAEVALPDEPAVQAPQDVTPTPEPTAPEPDPLVPPQADPANLASSDDTPEAQHETPPVPEDDEQAVDEIMDLLNVCAELTPTQEPGAATDTGPLADAVAKAQAAAQELGGSPTDPGTA